MSNNDLKYWVALSCFPKIGPKRFKKLLNFFPSMEAAFYGTFQDLKRSGLEEDVIQELIEGRSKINPQKEWERLEREKIQVLTIRDKNYPKLLKEIYDPPQLLYFKGTLENLNEYALAVVGTRKTTSYGRQVAPQIVKDLAQNGIIIVSGLALGIDALAHKAALEVGGITIAVLGSGLARESIYPRANLRLSDEIIANGGALISEYPITAPPLKQNFPHRNRIISGLSLGTLVIEAPETSGALITAKCALDQNRDVFATPGSIYNPTSTGPNNLIKMGAKPVTSASDILDALNIGQISHVIQTRKIIPDTREEEILLKFLSHEHIHIDRMVQLAGLDAATINSTLTMMEMKGKIRNLGGMNYVLAR